MGTSNKQGALSKQLETLERSKDENAAEISRFGRGRLEIEYKLEKKSIDKRELTKELKEKRKTQTFFLTHLQKYKQNSLQRFGEEIIQLEDEIEDGIEDILEDEFFQAASNSWAVMGEHTESGKPMLANDFHMGANCPSMLTIGEL